LTGPSIERSSLTPTGPSESSCVPSQTERYRDVLVGFDIGSHEPTAAEFDGFAAEAAATDR
jgi:hypothetical protein